MCSLVAIDLPLFSSLPLSISPPLSPSLSLSPSPPLPPSLSLPPSPPPPLPLSVQHTHLLLGAKNTPSHWNLVRYLFQTPTQLCFLDGYITPKTHPYHLSIHVFSRFFPTPFVITPHTKTCPPRPTLLPFHLCVPGMRRGRRLWYTTLLMQNASSGHPIVIPRCPYHPQYINIHIMSQYVTLCCVQLMKNRPQCTTGTFFGKHVVFFLIELK